MNFTCDLLQFKPSFSLSFKPYNFVLCSLHQPLIFTHLLQGERLCNIKLGSLHISNKSKRRSLISLLCNHHLPSHITSFLLLTTTIIKPNGYPQLHPLMPRSPINPPSPPHHHKRPSPHHPLQIPTLHHHPRRRPPRSPNPQHNLHVREIPLLSIPSNPVSLPRHKLDRVPRPPNPRWHHLCPLIRKSPRGNYERYL